MDREAGTLGVTSCIRSLLLDLSPTGPGCFAKPTPVNSRSWPNRQSKELTSEVNHRIQGVLKSTFKMFE
jgi:hypothetical protein